jgi:hypothetical protein
MGSHVRFRKEEKSAHTYGIRISNRQKFTTGKIFRLHCTDNLEQKYFDYFVFNIVDYGVNCGLPRSGARRRALAQTIGNTGGSTSTRPGVSKMILKTCDFINISNTAIPTTLGGSTITSPLIVVVILRQQLDYIYVYADHAAPDKS